MGCLWGSAFVWARRNWKSAWRAVPCDLLEKIRPGLRRELRGRRGMLCRVIAGGMIRRGDNIERIP